MNLKTPKGWRIENEYDEAKGFTVGSTPEEVEGEIDETDLPW